MLKFLVFCFVGYYRERESAVGRGTKCISFFCTTYSHVNGYSCLTFCCRIQVRDRCKKEWRIFQDRVSNAEKAYYKSVGVGSTDHEANWVTDDRIQ